MSSRVCCVLPCSSSSVAPTHAASFPPSLGQRWARSACVRNARCCLWRGLARSEPALPRGCRGQHARPAQLRRGHVEDNVSPARRRTLQTRMWAAPVRAPRRGQPVWNARNPGKGSQTAEGGGVSELLPAAPSETEADNLPETSPQARREGVDYTRRRGGFWEGCVEAFGLHPHKFPQFDSAV